MKINFEKLHAASSCEGKINVCNWCLLGMAIRPISVSARGKSSPFKKMGGGAVGMLARLEN